MIRNLTVCLMMLLISSSVSAKSAREMLEQFLQTTKTMQSTFEQRLFDQRNILLQESSGRFSLKRPGRFYWDYKQPYEQKIISNGKKIWLFDSELDQVTVKAYDQLLAGAPVILLGQNKRLDQEFHVEDQGLKNKLYWVKLTPLKKDGDYSSIEVGMLNDKIHRMIFVDSFEQTTVISFKNIHTNKSIQDRFFDFQPPEGVDVVGDF